MRSIDFHTHILLGIDDGSRDVEMSGRMLEMCEAQGIGTVVATPHFYAGSMTMDGFLKRRDAAYESIRPLAAEHHIRLIPSAEVAFFSGMGDADGLEGLTIAGTALLLLEMPFRTWNAGDIREVEKLLDRGLTPVIAHIERFYPYQKEKRIFDGLYALPVYVQVNAEAMMTWKTRRLAIKLFREGNAHLLGSDCHNTSSRPPNLMAGREIIEKKLGSQYLAQIDRLGEEVLTLNEKTT